VDTEESPVSLAQVTRFRTVNGVAPRGLTRLRLADGSRVDTFAGTAVQGEVAQLVRRGAWLYVDGNFTGVNGRARTAVARLDAATGSVDDGFNPVLSGPRSGGRLSVVGMGLIVGSDTDELGHEYHG
jgi:hypothetical protein